jgi:septal ring-binding cell division protein DamX
MRRYKAHNPYSHRTFFFILAAFESLLKIAAVIAIVLGSYLFLKNKIQLDNPVTASDQNTQSVEAPVVTVAGESAGDRVADAVTGSSTAIASQASSELQTASERQNSEAQSEQPVAAISPAGNTSTAEILNSQAGVDWIGQLEPSDFIIQFAATPDQSAIMAFATENLATTGAAIYPFKRTPSGRQVFGVAAVESYGSLESAQLALQSLPAALQQQKPWIRPVKDLQTQVLETL